MSTPNIGWLYFKDYQRQGISPVALFQNAPNGKNETKRKEYFENHFKEKNKTILEQVFSSNISSALISELAKSNIPLKTTYPGLTLGTGYTHEINETGEFKLGFFFDHTTGYPCIPGSTVKGCLRSMFPQKEHDDSDELSNEREKYNYLASVIRELSNLEEGLIAENELGEEYDQKEHPKRKAFIDQLELEIFEGMKPFEKKDGTIENQPICIYERDIFFDAYLVSTQHPAINRSSYKNQKPFIGDDYITPHINRKKPELSPFTNPIPLMFLKILPEVTIQFQFDVKDGLLSKLQKEELFCCLLLDFGIGAKTNVGYGQFEEGFAVHRQEGNGTRQVSQEVARTEPQNYTGKLNIGEKLEAKVVDQSRKIVQIIVQGKLFQVEMSGNCPEQGKLICVKINRLSKQKEIQFVGFMGEVRN